MNNPPSVAGPGTLVRATPAQQAARWRLHHATWGDGFELDLYLRREAALRDHDVLAPVQTAWLLVDDDGHPLASCETYQTAFWTVDAEGHIGHEQAETVASVVVDPALRGRGHAMQLMAQLTANQRARGLTVSSLYSDVGPQLYRRSGYLLHPAVESWRAVDAASPWPAGVEELGVGDVAGLFATETTQQPAWLGGSAAPAIAEVPRVDRVLWFHLRSQYRAWARGQAPSPVVGASAGIEGWCLWTSDSASPQLHVLLWRPHGADGARRLTAACLSHAAGQGLREVVWWDADRDTGLDPYRRPQLQPPATARRTRESGLPMLAWLDPQRSFPLVWMGIDRLGWR